MSQIVLILNEETLMLWMKKLRPTAAILNLSSGSEYGRGKWHFKLIQTINQFSFTR